MISIHKIIDPHVHCRDGNQAYKETIAHVFKIAETQGVTHIFDMPNTEPPIVSEADIQKRLKLVPPEEKDNYFLYLGLTSDSRQLEKAVIAFRKLKEIIGFKMYAGRSVGDLAIIKEGQQRKVYAVLTALEYKGVVAVHCEKESELNPDAWDPHNPISHCSARPKEAEIASIQDQINFVKESGFQGTLHIVHVSCPESVELIDVARKEIKITCGVTPHHILWNKSMLKRPDGLIYKMNPPLRSRTDVLGLRRQLKAGKIDWIETDHAHHHFCEKVDPPYLSGYPSLHLYRKLLTKLQAIGLTPQQIRKLTLENICKTFSLEV